MMFENIICVGFSVCVDCVLWMSVVDDVRMCFVYCCSIVCVFWCWKSVLCCGMMMMVR